VPPPPPLVTLLNSLDVVGVPAQAAAGDRISPRLVPDLAPIPAATPELPDISNPTLAGLAQTEVLAHLTADVQPLVAYVAATLGLDLATIAKAVEFAKPVEQRAADLDVTDVNAGDLPHLIPRAVGAGNVVEISPNVEGLIGRTIGDLTFDAGELVSEMTATITKPALLIALPEVDVTFRVVDEAGTPLVAGVHYFQAGDMFAPEFVLLPFVVEPAPNAPPTVKRNFYCDVTITFTPVGGAEESIARTIGPLPVDLATIAIPFVAVLTEHAIGDSRFPGRVLVAVPENSPVSDAAAAFAALAAIRGALGNVSTVLGLIGIGVPPTITAALGAINTVVGVPVGRFRTGNLIGFFEWRFGIPPWDDWQGIFSAMFVFGSAIRRAFTGIPLPFAGFSLAPSALGVGAITNLSIFPLAPGVGTATQVAPAPPAAPPGGSFNDLVTSINFPVP
jgi:hypothetical protein